MKARIRHYLQLGAAFFLLLVGIFLLISPIPIGIFFIAVGLSLLIYTSETIQQKIYNYRRQHSKINIRIIWVEEKLERRVKFISRTLRKTRPNPLKDD